MNPVQLLNLPIRLFWCLSRHVDRIRADNDLRLLDLYLITVGAAMGGGKEALDGYRAALMEQRGTIVKEAVKVSSPDDIMRLMEM